MDIRTIVNEPRRGCGFRKAGGLYLMAGGPAAPCGKLPLALEVCPACGQGIKPARGWTWVDAAKLFAEQACTFPATGDGADCRPCPLSWVNLQQNPRMGLLWVGEQFYPMPADFLREGEAQGISRRIQAIPRDFVIAETWVLFAHRKAIQGPDIHREPAIGNIDWLPGIFSAFRPQRIEYVIKADDPAEKLEALERRGISLVQLARTDGADGNGTLDLEPEEATV